MREKGGLKTNHHIGNPVSEVNERKTQRTKEDKRTKWQALKNFPKGKDWLQDWDIKHPLQVEESLIEKEKKGGVAVVKGTTKNRTTSKGKEVKETGLSSHPPPQPPPPLSQDNRIGVLTENFKRVKQKQFYCSSNCKSAPHPEPSSPKNTSALKTSPRFC